MFGFQLTYLATFGIILVLPRCEPGFAAVRRPLRWVIESVAISVAATAMTLPILASAFNRVSPAGLLANIPIVPLSGLITGLGTAACALFLVVPAGIAGLNQLNGWLVNLLFELARWFAGWPWSSVRVFTPTCAMLVTYYAAMAMLLWAFPCVPAMGSRARSRRWAAGGAMVCGVGLGMQALWLWYPPERGMGVRVTFLDVGQGEAIFVDTSGNGRMLVDAGGTLGGGFDIGQHVIVPFLWHEWVGHLDVLALTHPQSDHIGGAPTLLRTLSVGEVWTGPGRRFLRPTCGSKNTFDGGASRTEWWWRVTHPSGWGTRSSRCCIPVRRAWRRAGTRGGNRGPTTGRWFSACVWRIRRFCSREISNGTAKPRSSTPVSRSAHR